MKTIPLDYSILTQHRADNKRAINGAEHLHKFRIVVRSSILFTIYKFFIRPHLDYDKFSVNQLLIEYIFR